MEILPFIANSFGGPVWYRKSTDSTMIDAENLLSRPASAGSIVMSDYQSAGQGRFANRQWLATPGESLLFTLIVPPALAAPGHPGFPVSLLMALGLCRWLVGLGLEPAIKWPNDILVGDRKLAGILITGLRGYYLVGIGINLHQKSWDQDSLRRPATSLFLEGVNLSSFAALPAVLQELYRAFEEPEPRQSCESWLWRCGQEFTLNLGADQPPVTGLISGLATNGALIMDCADGPRQFISGE